MRIIFTETHVLVDNANVTPVWLLPFWRLVKGEAAGHFVSAYRALPKHLPHGTKCPTIEELATALRLMGLV